MNTCIIPMRSGSKRLKDKNIIDFYGNSIFTYPLDTARDSGLFDRIYLAIDEEYKNIVNEYCLKYSDGLYGYNGPEIYIRLKSNSRNKSTLYDLIEEISNKEKLDGNICIIYSTSVLTTIEQLTVGKEKLKYFDCVFPAVITEPELMINGEKCYYTDKQYFKKCNDDIACHADAWFWFKLDPILKNGKTNRQILQEENGYIVLKDYECQPVHTKEDVEDLKIKYQLIKMRQLERGIII